LRNLLHRYTYKYVNQIITLNPIAYIKKKRKNKEITAFFTAVKTGDINTVRKKLKTEYEINQPYPDSDWPIALTSVKHPEILRLLISHGAEINNQESHKWYSPLINAVRFSQVESVNILLENNADTHLTSFAGLPALVYALEIKNEEIIELLLKNETSAEFLEKVKKICYEKGIDTELYL